MKISLKWLNDYVSVDMKPDEFSHKLTMAGLEVENIHSVNDDTVFEIEVTPNRPDCLNMLGIAREVSAILDIGRSFPQKEEVSFPQERCDIEIQEKEGCLRYIGTIIKDVTIKKAEDFFVKRILSNGLRPINNVVDITNFCLLEMGQPMHAFDYDKLIGGKIIVRRAKKGEKIVTIDDVERELDPSILIIADEKKPVAIAGVMGGKETEVSDSTKNILLESAYFDPILIRRASRKLGLSSDSSYRFERGVDFKGVENGSERAIKMILDSAKGEITNYLDLKEEIKVKQQEVIKIKIEMINHFLGASLTEEKCSNVLQKLDFSVKRENGELTVQAPTFRSDIKREVDVIEEIARVIGYDNLPYSVPNIVALSMGRNQKRDLRTATRNRLVSQGLNEVVSYTMINRRALQKTNQENLDGTVIINPLTVDQEILRPSMLPSMLTLAQFNINRGEKNLKIFETGKAYLSGQEKERLSVLMTGLREKDWRSEKINNVDFFDIKGAIEQLLVKGRIQNIKFIKCEKKYFDVEESASICVNGEIVGEIGKITQSVLDNWSIKQRGLYYAELELEKIYSLMKEQIKFQVLSEYPSIVWDISLAVKMDITFEEVRAIAKSLGGDLLKDIHFKEEYVGDKVEKGQRGIIFSLIYQSAEKTLTEAEVSIIHNNICQALVEKLEAVKR